MNIEDDGLDTFAGDGEAMSGGEPEASPSPPAEAIDHLRKNPHLSTDFDALFGSGAAAKHLGTGTSPLAREMQASGELDAIAARAQRDQDTGSFLDALQRKWAESTERYRQQVFKPLIQSEIKPGGLMGEAGKLTPEQRRAAGESEVETAKVVAPIVKSVAETAKAAQDYVPRISYPGAALRAAEGLFASETKRQEERIATGEKALKGEAPLPEYAAWRSSLDKLAQTVASMPGHVAQFAGIWGGYGAEQLGYENAAIENPVYKFGKDAEDYAKRLFPDDEARRYQFLTDVSQGVGSTIGMAGPGFMARVLGAGEKGVLATIAFMGAAEQVPDEFAKATKALKAGDATEWDRFINLMANTALGATEAYGAAPMIAMPGKRGARQALKRGLEGAFEEAGQEVVQQTGSNVAAMVTYDPTQDPYEGVLNSAAVAGVTGGSFGVATSRARAKAEEAEQQLKAAEERAAQVADVRQRIADLEGEVLPRRPDLSPMAKPVDRTAGEIAQAPTFQDVLGAIPKDSGGDPDIAALQSAINNLGAKSWAALTPEQRQEVYRTFKPVEDAANAAFETLQQTMAAPKSTPEEVAAAKRRGWGGQAEQPQQGAGDIRQRFDQMLGGKTRRADWAKAIGATPEQIKGLIDEAVKDGRLKMVRGQPVRTGKKVPAVQGGTTPTARAEPRGMDGLTRSERSGKAAPIQVQPGADAGASPMERFRAAYEATLAEQVRANPSKYAYGVDRVPEMARRITEALAEGRGDTSSPTVKAVAKALGIPLTVGGMKAALSGQPAPAPRPQKSPLQKAQEASDKAEAARAKAWKDFQSGRISSPDWVAISKQAQAAKDALAAAKQSNIIEAAKQSGRLEIATVGDTPKAAAAPPATLGEVRPGADRVARFREQLATTGFKTIVEARKAAKDAGITETGKALDELIEAQLVEIGREIAKTASSPGEAYQQLVSLYDKQPNLATRTSTSVANQAYSTPLPLAYLASRLADVAGSNVVYEPSAGNGALLIEADPATQTVYANELDDRRAKALEAQGFRATTTDATDPALAAKIKATEPAGAVIMNPPFGAVREGGKSRTWDIGKWQTSQVDHAIAFRGLEAMADNGRAVLIVGGIKANSIEERRKGYRGQAKRDFYTRLYGQYNVVDHFTVSGDLYRKQGAGWPVDVIVIDGRGKSTRTLPAAAPPTIYDSWDALAEKLPDGQARNPADGSVGATDRGVGQSAPGDAGSVEPADGRGSGQPESGTEDKSARVRSGSDRGQSATPRGVSDAPGVPEQPGRSGDTGAADQPASPRQQRVKRAPKGGQAQYEPASQAVSLDTLIPVNMATAARAAMQRIEEKHGSVDALVADRLGYKPEELSSYFSAEQVDAIAAAIDNVERGAAFIIGDQTGIGKGRIVAGMLRYAIKRGMVPVLVTEKPDLYGDMYRDMRDIGMPEMLGREPRMFMTNSGETVTLDETALEWKQEADAARAAGEKVPAKRGKFLSGGTAARQQDDMRAILNGEDRYDVVFTTYDQMNTVKGQTTPRRQFLQQLGPRALIAFDESHNAGGAAKTGWESKNKPTNRADFARELARDAQGVIFSSATYAKRPDVMDLYARTDMGQAVDDPKLLPGLIQSGKVPMQQIVATMLSDAGQYLRRERSFDGLEYAIEPVPVDADTYRQFSDAIRAVFRFDLAVKDVRQSLMEDVLDAQGMAQSKDTGVGEAAAHTTAFSSLMHNIVNQMLLAIKAKATAKRAIEAFNSGEKPVIALANTNESFIRDFAAQEGIEIGDAINLDFGDVLRRYLSRTLRITIKQPEGETEHHQIPVEDLPAHLREMYRDAEIMINGGNYAGLPISPIDAIRSELGRAGMKVAEVTGRQTMIDYSAKTPKYVQRPRGEQGPSGKRSSIAAFNAGRLDALILNRSGSTGVSMHASEKFKDQRRRRMILAQAEANIDTHLQMLGRVHRTGQVTPPAYSQIAAEIPAEARPTAVLMRKMASLNANTTGARGSVFMADSVDFMNEVGDKVVFDYLGDNPEVEDELGGDILKTGDDGLPSAEDAAKRATGRLVLLPPEKQAEFLESVQSAYNAAIEELDALGENPLEAKTLDLQARTIETTTLKEATGEGPFKAAAQIEKVSIKASGRAMSVDDIAGEVAKALGVGKPEGDTLEAVRDLAVQGREWSTKRIADLEARVEEWMQSAFADMEDEAKAKAVERERAQLRRVTDTLRLAYPGSRVSLTTNGGEEINGIVLSVERTGKAKSQSAPGSWTMTVAVPDSMRVMKLTLSKVFPPSVEFKLSDKGARLFRSDMSLTDLAQEFDKARLEGRETRYIVTGNILAGFDQTHGKGRIINFTAEDGSLRPGILMNRGFEVGKFMEERSIRFKTGEQVAQFLDRADMATVRGSDGNIAIAKRGDTYVIQTPSARGTGGRYYTDPDVRDAIAPIEFVKMGGSMVARGLNRRQIVRAVDAIRSTGALLETKSDQDIAQEITAPKEAQQPEQPRQGPPPLTAEQIALSRKDRSYALNGNGFSDGMEQDRATRIVSLGRRYDVDPAVVEGMREAVKALPQMAPAQYQPGFLVASIPQSNGRLIAVLERVDGSLVGLDLPVDEFSGARALFDHRSGTIGFFSFDLPIGFENRLRGELWHEVIHAVRKAGNLDDIKFGDLLAHANNLRVLEMSYQTFRRALGDPQWESYSGTGTLAENYMRAYRHMRPEALREALNQEAVAHMTELLIAGVPLPLPENVRQIYADIETGKRGGVEQGVEVDGDEVKYRLGHYLWRTSLDALAEQNGATLISKVRPWQSHPGPVLAFHGTTAAEQFDRFDLSKAVDLGLHFGTVEHANKFAAGRTFRGEASERAGRVFPVVLNVRNPITMPDMGDWMPGDVIRELDKQGIKIPHNVRVIAERQRRGPRFEADLARGNAALREELSRQGYDSIRYLNRGEGLGLGWSYIVWEKGAVSSAINDDVLFALRRYDPTAGKWVERSGTTPEAAAKWSAILDDLPVDPAEVKRLAALKAGRYFSRAAIAERERVARVAQHFDAVPVDEITNTADDPERVVAYETTRAPDGSLVFGRRTDEDEGPLFAFGGRYPTGVSVERDTNSMGQSNYKINLKAHWYSRTQTIGEAYVRDLGDSVQVGRISIADDYQRAGIATALYAQIESDLGKPLVPDGTLSEKSYAFWMKHRPEAVEGKYNPPQEGGHFWTLKPIYETAAPTGEADRTTPILEQLAALVRERDGNGPMFALSGRPSVLNVGRTVTLDTAPPNEPAAYRAAVAAAGIELPDLPSVEALQRALTERGIGAVRYPDGKGGYAYSVWNETNVVSDADAEMEREQIRAKGERAAIMEADDLYAVALPDGVISRDGKAFAASDGPMFAFAGEKARTADLDALAKAKKMEEDGHDAETIWMTTGWWRAPDEKWRFEIDDSAAVLTPDATAILTKGVQSAGELQNGWGFAEDVLDHPALYSAYPAMAAATAGVRRGLGQQSQLGADERMGQYDPAEDRVVTVAYGPGWGRRIFLHELQHAVQFEEGFAAESSPDEASIEVHAQEPMLPEDVLLDKAYALYRRSAGEVEARAVERRRNMTPEQRKARAPWLDYDVAPDDQIVRFDGKSQAMRPIERTTRLYRGEPANATGGLGHHYTRSLDRARGFAGPDGKVYMVEVPIERMGELKPSRAVGNFIVPRDIRETRMEVSDGSDLMFALEDRATGQSMRRDLDALGYYSQALEAARGLKQAKGTPEQMLAQLKSAGVKDAEIEATRLRAALDGKKSVTKDEIVQHLESNRVGVREVVRRNARQDAMRRMRDEFVTDNGDGTFTVSGLDYEDVTIRGEDRLRRYLEPHVRNAVRVDELADHDRPGSNEHGPKWSSYSLDPSNPSYRETVLHLPRNKGYNENVFNQRASEAYEAVRAAGGTDAQANEILGDIGAASDGDTRVWLPPQFEVPSVRNAVERALDATKKHPDFLSGHFSEPNIVGHMMTSMVKHEGKPVYLIDQIQSDWGQKLRDGDVRDEAKIAELKARIEKLNERVPELAKILIDDMGMRRPSGGEEYNYPRWLAKTIERLLPNRHDATANLYDWGQEWRLLNAEIETAEAATPGHPLVNTTDQWTITTLRRAIRQAAEAGADYIAIPHGDTVLSYNPGDEAGMRGFYGADTSPNGVSMWKKQIEEARKAKLPAEEMKPLEDALRQASEIEGIVPKNLRKLLSRIDKDSPKPVRVKELETPSGKRGYRPDKQRDFDKDRAGFTLFPLTDKVKRSVIDDGQPMFALDRRRSDDSLDAIIEKLADTVGLTIVQGLRGMSVERGGTTANVRPGDGKDRGKTKDGRPRQRFGNTWIGASRILGQYDNYSGVARMRSVRQIDQIAHEAAHHLERLFGAELLNLQQQHLGELSSLTVPGMAETPSEQWAEFFRLYVMNPAAARLAAPGLYRSFEDMVEAEMPGMLEQFGQLHDMLDRYNARTPLDKVAADLVATKQRNIVERTYGSYRDGTLAGDISVGLSRMYTGLYDKLNPIWHLTRALLEVADANGVRGPDGKPLSLRVTQNPYKLMRAFAGSYKKGHNWLTRGIRDPLNDRDVAPPLRDALVKVFGGETGIASTGAAAAGAVVGGVVGGPLGALVGGTVGSALYGKASDMMRGTGWDAKRYQDFNAYVMAIAALERYDQYEKKMQAVADANQALTDAAQARPALAERARKDAAVLERRRTAMVRLEALLRDRRRAAGVADTNLRNAAKRLDEKKDNQLAAQMARDESLTDRRTVAVRDTERDQSRLVKEATAAQKELADLEIQHTMLTAEIEQLQAAADASADVVSSLDEMVEQLKALKKRELGTGIHRPPVLETQAELEQAKAEAEAKYPQFPEAARIFHEYVHGLLVMEYRAGFHSDAEFQALAQNSAWYAPLMRDMSDIREAKRQGQSGRSWTPHQRLKGSDRAVINPVDIIIERSYQLARKTAYDAAVKTIVDLTRAVGPGHGAIAEEVSREETTAANQAAFERIMANAQALGIDETEAKQLLHLMEHETTGSDLQWVFSPATKGPKPGLRIPYWENGERKMLQINDADFAEEIFNSINGIGEDLNNIFVKAVAAPSRWLSFGVTAHPAFAIVNMGRDMMAAWMLTGALPIVTQARGIAMELGTHKLFDSDLWRDWSPAWMQRKIDEWSEFVRRYHDAGGIRGGQFAATMGDVREKGDWTGIRDTGFHVSVKRIWDLIELSETSTRLGVARAAYKRAKKFDPTLSETEAVAEAAFTARDILDFDRRGSKLGVMTKLVAFMNPNIQGMDKAIRTMVGAGDRGSAIKKKLQIVFKRQSGIQLSAQEERDAVDAFKFAVRLAAFNAAVVGLYMLHAGDPEEEEINDRMKPTHSMVDIANFWANMQNSAFGKALGFPQAELDPDKKWRRLPLPFELATPAVIWTWAVRTYRDKDPQAYTRLFDSLYDLLAPPVIPQAVKVTAEPSFNYSTFTGRPIVSADAQKLPSTERYEWFTSSIAKRIGHALDVAPLKVDYVITNSLGYIGREIQRFGEWVLPEGKVRPGQDDPMIDKRLRADPYRGANSTTEFYKQMKPDGGGGGPAAIIRGLIVDEGMQYVQAAAAYKRIIDEQNPLAAKAWLAKQPDEMQAYAYLQTHFSTAMQKMHPMNRLDSIVQVVNRMQREIVNGELKEAIGARRRRNVTLEGLLKPDPQQEEILLDILRRVNVTEARNTLIAMGHGRWKGKERLPIDLVLDELNAANPKVYDELMKRISLTKVPGLDDAARAWRAAKPELLREQENATLSDATAAIGGAPQIGTREERRPAKVRIPVH